MHKELNCTKYKRFLSAVVWRASKSRFFWMIVVVLLSIIPRLVLTYGLKIIIDKVQGGHDFNTLLIIIIVLVGLQIIQYVVVSIYQQFIVPISDVRIAKYINDLIFNKMSNIDIS